MTDRRARLHKPLIIFCEGQTEFHYMDGYRKHHRFSFAIKMVDVKGGGYKKMRMKIIQSFADGVLARVVLLDLDRYHRDVAEQEELKRIIQLIHNQNKRGSPVLLVLSNPDFDDFIFLHDPAFSTLSKEKFIKAVGYSSVNELKADENLFETFNRTPRSMEVALTRLNPNCVAKNAFAYKPREFLLTNVLEIQWSNSRCRTSNIGDLFRLIGVNPILRELNRHIFAILTELDALFFRPTKP